VADAPRRLVPAGGVVTPRMRWLLLATLVLFALLSVDSIYLSAVTFLEWSTGERRQNSFYLWMFLGHLVLGLAIVLPTVAFGAWHWKRAHHHPNRRAVRMGNVTFVAALVTLVTGILLTRVELGGVTPELRHPQARSAAYWLHVLAPLVTVWGFVLHRLAGRRIRWSTGLAVAVAALALTAGFDLWHRADAARPRPQPKDGAAYFEPSLARTASGAFIPESSLMQNDECLSCHPDAYRSWAHSAHAASSFNNPMYAFSVRETRRQAFDREGSVQDARFCAGCHDPVPFFSGAFEDRRFDDPDYDVSEDPLGAASITCTACHSVTSVGSTRGNADYVIEESPQYPFGSSEGPLLRWVNRQLIKAKPAFHRHTFLKPEVHRSAEFCSTCHKVFLPEEVNDYKWLPGQNHYDSWRLSNRSGHGVQGWYWPKHPETDCNGCHMPAVASADLGAKPRGPQGELQLRDHFFPGGNTAVASLSGLPHAAEAVARTEAFNRDVLRIDVFALREDGVADGAISAPLGDAGPALEPGKRYLLELVVRTLGALGHEYTQGTADSNETWVDVTVRAGDRVIGRIGAIGTDDSVDPWSKFLNVYMLDREGRRIDRRNPQDIFVPLYNHQVPPGAADLTRVAFTVPADVSGPVTVEAAVRYRKFDAAYMRYVYGADRRNDLPVLTLATDRVTFGGAAPADGSASPGASASGVRGAATAVPDAERWLDAGIAHFRSASRVPGKGQWGLADELFARAADAGRVEGWIGRARTALLDGRLADAASHLRSAAERHAGQVPWAVSYWSAVVDMQQGEYERAIAGFRSVSESAFAEARERRYDFSRDDRVLVDWATACLERSRQLRGPDDAARRAELLAEAVRLTDRALAEDSQRFQTWYVRMQALEASGDAEGAAAARASYERFRPDDNARDRAVTLARSRDPAADHAAEPSAIFDLQRPGAPGLPAGAGPLSSAAGSGR
jgi:tetratricopeptide (TPR) repeat protein